MKHQISLLSALVLASVSLNAYAATSTNGTSLLPLRVIDESEQGIATSCVVLNDSLEGSVDVNSLKSYVSLSKSSDKTPIAVAPFLQDKKLCFGGLEFGQSYQLVLKKGLSSVNNKKIDSDIVKEFTTIDSRPTISFANGLVLAKNSEVFSNNAEGKIAISSVNFDSFKLSMFRISPKDIPASELYSKFDNMERWQLSQLIQEHGTFIQSKVYSINKDNKNKKIITYADLKDFKKKLNDGIYVLLITQNDNNNGNTIDKLVPDYDSLAVSKLLFISDLGVTTYKGATGIDVAVRSINSARPKSNIQVSLISVGNEVIATQQTNSLGFAHFSDKLCNGDNSSAPALIMVNEGSKDFFPLDLRSNNLYLEDAAGSSDNQGNLVTNVDELNHRNLKVYAFTNRSILRPGEKLYYQTYLRDKNLNAANLKALKLTIYKPDFSVFKEITLSNPKAGTFDYEYEFDESAPLGTYKFELGFDKDSVLASNEVTLAAFKPSSLTNTLKTASGTDVIKQNDTIYLNSEFNYGAPAKNLNVNGYSSLTPDNHPVSKYSDYYFGVNDSDVPNLTKNINIDSSTTDGSGNYSFKTNFDTQTYPQKYEVNLSVLDPASNVSYVSGTYKVEFPTAMFGVKVLDQDITSDTTKLNVVLSDQSGKLYSSKAQYVIKKHNVSYQYAFVDDTWKYIKNDYLTPVISGELDVDGDDSNLIELSLNDGSYVLDILSPDSKCTTSYNFYKGTKTSYDPSTPDRFVLTTDKKSYKKGDDVVLSFDSEFDGFADLALGNDGVIDLSHHKITRGHNTIEIPASDDFGTGSYALLTTYSALNNKYKTAARAIGLAYIKMDAQDKKLDLSASIPEIIKPNDTLSFDINVKNADGSKLKNKDTYVSVSLVDNGILSINNQKAPKPFEALTDRENLCTKLYDMYSYIIKDVKGTGQGYGDNEMLSAANAQALSNINDNLLSLYTKHVYVVNGVAHVEFKLPALSTSAKLMVTAFNDKQLGSMDTDIVIKDKSVAKIVAPYYMHKGDSLISSLNITNLSLKGDSPTYTYDVKCSGAISCNLKGETVVGIKDESISDFTLLANDVGEGQISYKVKSNDNHFVFENTKTIKVLDNQFDISETRIDLLDPNEKKSIQFNQKFVDNTKVGINISPLPFVSNTKILESLDNDYNFSIFDATAKGLALSNVIQNDKGEDTQYDKDVVLKLNKILSYLESVVNQQGNIDFNLVDYEQGRFASAYVAQLIFKADRLGFSVSDKTKEYLAKALNRNITDDNEQTAALSMRVLSRQNYNIKANLTYRFDHNDIKSIKALSDYAVTFHNFGDKNREKEAILRGMKSLKEVTSLRTALAMSTNKEQRENLVSQIKQYDPFYINTYSYDVLSLLSATLDSNSKDMTSVITSLCQKLEVIDDFQSNYFDIPSKAIMTKLNILDLEHRPIFVNDVVHNGAIHVFNPSSEKQFVTVTAYGKVDGPIDNSKDLKIQKRYFKLNGTELESPISLNVNDDIIVLTTVVGSSNVKSTITLEEMLPSNMMYLRSIGNDEAAESFNFLGKLSNSYELKQFVGDTNIISVSNSDSSVMTIAYILKAAYVGDSVPCMSQTTQKAISANVSYLLDKAGINVK